jgi:hypothetical protein
MKTEPEIIWLQWYNEDGTPAYEPTWCDERIGKKDTPYYRRNKLSEKLKAEIIALRKLVKDAYKEGHEDAGSAYYVIENIWKTSNSKKALDKQINNAIEAPRAVDDK